MSVTVINLIFFGGKGEIYGHLNDDDHLLKIGFCRNMTNHTTDNSGNSLIPKASVEERTNFKVGPIASMVPFHTDSLTVLLMKALELRKA